MTKFLYIFLVGVFFLAAGQFQEAAAQAQREINWCTGKSTATPEQMVRGCSAIIQSGRTKGNALAGAYSNRSLAYQRMQQLDKAMEDYERALRIAPNLDFALIGRGGLFLTLGDYDRGIDDLKRAIRNNPRLALAHYNLGNGYYAKNELDAAIDSFSQVIKIDPNYGPAYANRSIALTAKSDFDRAVADATSAIQRLPGLAQPYANRALAYAKKGDLPLAIKDLNECIRLERKPVFFLARGEAYQQTGQYTLAIVDYDQAISIDPQNAEAWNGRCWARAVAGTDLEQALADCNRSLDIRPNTANTLDSRALIYIKLNKLDDAIADYDAALRSVGYEPGKRVDSNFAGALYGRGVAKQKKGDQLGAAIDIAAAKVAKPSIVEDFARYGVK